jgi:hypothetical protein
VLIITIYLRALSIFITQYIMYTHVTIYSIYFGDFSERT